MALEYGADLVYTPEVVDKGIVGCERVVNGIVVYSSFPLLANLYTNGQEKRLCDLCSKWFFFLTVIIFC